MISLVITYNVCSNQLAYLWNHKAFIQVNTEKDNPQGNDTISHCAFVFFESRRNDCSISSNRVLISLEAFDVLN